MPKRSRSKAASSKAGPSEAAPSRTAPRPLPGSPFLTHIGIREDRVQPDVHPFTMPLLAQGLDIELTAPITFLVGENGSGKSTLLEALGWMLGFSAQGGNRTNHYAEGADGHALGRALSLAWRHKVSDGFYLRAAQILSLDGGYIHPVKYEDTDHYCIMRDFLNAPERFYRYLFEEEDSP